MKETCEGNLVDMSQWPCPMCTFLNGWRTLRCEMCQTPKPRETPQAPPQAPKPLDYKKSRKKSRELTGLDDSKEDERTFTEMPTTRKVGQFAPSDAPTNTNDDCKETTPPTATRQSDDPQSTTTANLENKDDAFLSELSLTNQDEETLKETAQKLMRVAYTRVKHSNAVLSNKGLRPPPPTEFGNSDL